MIFGCTSFQRFILAPCLALSYADFIIRRNPRSGNEMWGKIKGLIALETLLQTARQGVRPSLSVWALNGTRRQSTEGCSSHPECDEYTPPQTVGRKCKQRGKVVEERQVSPDGDLKEDGERERKQRPNRVTLSLTWADLKWSLRSVAASQVCVLC